MMFRTRICAASLPLLALGLACSQTPPEPIDQAEGNQSASDFECVRTAPIAADGYDEILDANPSLAKLADVATPSAEAVSASTKKIAAHVGAIRALPQNKRRVEVFSGKHRGTFSEPYCLFHAPTRPVYGTVVLFHGFNDRPLQQAKLASYLFHSGFNVYNVHLAFHYLVPGTDSWPRTVYEKDVLAANSLKLQSPALRPIVARIVLKFSEGLAPSLEDLSPGDLSAINGALQQQPFPITTESFANAWANPTSAEFKTLFGVPSSGPAPATADGILAAAQKADYASFIAEARARISEVSGLGPVFLGGLSVGGAVALAAAADDGGAHVKGTMAHAPWLKSVNDGNNKQTSLLAPLDQDINKVKAGSYPMIWGNHKIAFSPASIAADLALGSWVGANAAKLVGIPTAMVVTDAEKSAHNPSSQALHDGLSRAAAGRVPHVRAAYPAEDKIGHALTDPENYANGDLTDANNAEHWNTRWRQLYQESFRFYTSGKIDSTNLLTADPRSQDATIPQVKCRATEWDADKGERCSASER